MKQYPPVYASTPTPNVSLPTLLQRLLCVKVVLFLHLPPSAPSSPLVKEPLPRRSIGGHQQ